MNKDYEFRSKKLPDFTINESRVEQWLSDDRSLLFNNWLSRTSNRMQQLNILKLTLTAIHHHWAQWSQHYKADKLIILSQ